MVSKCLWFAAIMTGMLKLILIYIMLEKIKIKILDYKTQSPVITTRLSFRPAAVIAERRGQECPREKACQYFN
jgi:hypothetical protein